VAQFKAILPQNDDGNSLKPPRLRFICSLWPIKSFYRHYYWLHWSCAW